MAGNCASNSRPNGVESLQSLALQVRSSTSRSERPRPALKDAPRGNHVECRSRCGGRLPSDARLVTGGRANIIPDLIPAHSGEHATNRFNRKRAQRPRHGCRVRLLRFAFGDVQPGPKVCLGIIVRV